MPPDPLVAALMQRTPTVPARSTPSPEMIAALLALPSPSERVARRDPPPELPGMPVADFLALGGNWELGRPGFRLEGGEFAERGLMGVGPELVTAMATMLPGKMPLRGGRTQVSAGRMGTVNILRNPPDALLLRELQASPYKMVRWIVDKDGNQYVWDAGKLWHEGAAFELGVDIAERGALKLDANGKIVPFTE